MPDSLRNPVRLLIVHNVMWSDYKASVFNALSLLQSSSFHISFVQIALTGRDRKALGAPNLEHHQYPYTLLFKDSFEEVSQIKMAVKLMRVMAQFGPTTVVLPGYERPAYWALLAACIVTGSRRILTLDSTIFDNRQTFLKSLLKRLFVKLCSGALCYGTRSREYLVYLGMEPSKIAIRCQAAANDLLLRGAGDFLEKAIHRNWMHNETLDFLYVGRLAHEKGIETLISAFEAISMRNKRTRLRIAGAGPLSEVLEAQAKASKAAGSITFLGPMSKAELAPLYAEAYCLVLPSESEPWGLVVNEAMLFGCPAIVSNRCGCAPDLIIEGKTGYVFNAGCANSLAQALDNMVSSLPNRTLMGQESRTLISGFSPEAAASQIKNAVLTLSGSDP